MNSQGFLTIVVISTLLFVFWYWKGWGAASKGPTQLNLRANDSEPLVVLPQENNISPEASAKRAKSLNVIFNYNGHSWDAYEVLGVPAGSGIQDVTAAYQAALRKNQKETHVFLETAYKAILHRT